jgi:predicted ATPase/DNA-binding SARP family transcriptional activator/Tfp pilus assembly protein PilF
MSGLTLSLLGPLAITLDNRPFSALRIRPALALFIYLACRPERHRREHLMTLLWPDWSPASAQQNLRQNLYVLRQTLPEVVSPNGGQVPLILADRYGLQLNPDAAITVDAHYFASLIKRPTSEALVEAVGIYRGDFLADFYLPDSNPFEEWAAAQREAYRRLALEALERLANDAHERGDHRAAEGFARRQIEFDNLREGAHRQLMLALVYSGQRAAALTHHEVYRRVLREELAVEPSAEIRALVERITSGDEQPFLPAYSSPSTPKPRHNLPLQLSSFIGREREIIEVRELLENSRLVTLTGAGGSGKTRLALEAAAGLLEAFTDGVRFVDLAPLSNPSLLASTVASALGVVEDKERPLLEAIVDFLRGRQVLLLFDNCEHLVAAVARVVDTLLRQVPELTILATSREPLGISGEVVWLAPTLSLPPPGEQPTVNNLARYDAIRLFIDRATIALPAFTLNEDNAVAVTQVCRRLDGIPLAIELAAARVKLFRTEQIADRLVDRYRLLTGGSRVAPERHQTLRALIDWSYELLSAAEQRLLRRLSVFAGGFTLEAVQGICDEAGEGDKDDVFESLMLLVNKSLVVADRMPGQEARYDLHETIRQYGLAKLVKEGAEQQLRRRHASYFCRLAEEAEPRLYSGEQMAWLDHLQAEYDNLRAALDWSLTGRSVDVEIGPRLAAALAYYWEIRGHGLEGGRWLEAALGKIGDAAVPLQALLYLRAGNFWVGWENDKATPYARKSLALYRQLRDDKGIAWAMRLQGSCFIYKNDFEQAVSFLEQSLKLAEELDDKALITWVYHLLGWIAIKRGDYFETANLGEKYLVLACETGDGRAQVHSYFLLGETAARQGEFARAEALYSHALIIARNLKDGIAASRTLNQLGEAARRQKKYAQAEAHYRESLASFRDTQGWDTFAVPLSNLGHVAVRRGDPGRAADYFRESIDSDEELNAAPWNIWGMGVVAAARGKPGQAARLYAVMDKILEADSNEIVYREDWEDFRRDIAFVREQLGEADFSAAWAEGRRMSLEEAIAYALKEQI